MTKRYLSPPTTQKRVANLSKNKILQTTIHPHTEKVLTILKIHKKEVKLVKFLWIKRTNKKSPEKKKTYYNSKFIYFIFDYFILLFIHL